jgi:hypothetical protein
MCPQYRCSRKKRFGGGNDWLQKYSKYVKQWMNKERLEPTNRARSLPNEYREYLLWLHRTNIVHVKPPALSIPIDEGESDDEDPYDIITRTGVQPVRAPLENYMVSTKLQLCHLKS